MTAAPDALPVSIALLTEADEAGLLALELENREFFARTVGDRGDDYFAAFPARHARLVAENRDGTSMLFVVRDHEGRVVGRVNIGDIHDGSGDIGYRIAEAASGRGVARTAVRLALEAAAERGVTRITAATTTDNAGSQRVLAANGFEPLPNGEPSLLELGASGRSLPAVHFVRTLG
ncbi:MAG TPA: GNAT family N-acetyltransferase [Nocardioidaceae bacterium]